MSALASYEIETESPYTPQSEPDTRLADAIVKRQAMLEEKRSPTDQFWNLTDQIITPRRAVWDLGSKRGRVVGDKLGEGIYDQTSSSAGQDFADGLQGQTASAGLVWWAAHMRSKIAQKDYLARQWIDDLQDVASVEMGQSNFYSQYNEACQDGVFMGIATMAKPIWIASKRRLSFQTHHPREIFIARDYNGEINLWHRKFPVTNRALAGEFGIDLLPIAIRKSVEKDPYGRRMVIHAIYPNDERDVRKWTAENLPIASTYVLEDEKIILRKSGFKDWPMATWCFRRNSQEDYGRGPAMDAIFEAASTNSAMHYLLDAAQLAVQKPLVANEALKNKIKISGYGITWLSGNEQAPTELFRSQSEYPIGMDMIMKMREELRDKFKAKTFHLLSYLTQETSRMNMLQISEIQGEKAAALIPIVGPGQSEMLVPMINATIEVLAQAGRLPQPPATMAQYLDVPFDLEFLGPVAVAIKRYLQMQGVNPWLTRLVGNVPLAQVWPGMLDRVDDDALYDHLFEADGAPTKIERDPALVQKIRAAKAQAAEQQRKAAAAAQLADMAPKLSKAPEPGSPAQMMVQGGGKQ